MAKRRKFNPWFESVWTYSRVLAAIIFMLAVPFAILYSLFVEGIMDRLKALHQELSDIWFRIWSDDE